MNTASIGQTVAIRIADPWAIAESRDWPIAGVIRNITTIEGKTALVLHVHDPIPDAFISRTFSTIVATPRYAGVSTWQKDIETHANFAGLSIFQNDNLQIDPKLLVGIGHGTLMVT